MPYITAEFVALGLSLTAIGLVFPVRAIGGIVGNVVAGVGSDAIGRQRLVTLSALALVLALGATALAGPWLAFLFGLVAVSAAQSSLSTGINALIADANPNARGRALNVLHGVYGFGAAVSPLVIGYFLATGVPWRWALGGVAGIWLAYTVAAHLLAPNRHATGAVAQGAKLEWRLLGSRLVFALACVAFIYNGVATSLLGWVAVYMQQAAGFDAFGSVAMIALFYVALTIGRFLCAAFSERLGYGRTLRLLALGITLSYPLVLLTVAPVWIVIGVFLTGLSLSGLFPTALAIGARNFPTHTGAVTGILNIAMTLGATIPPLWTGALADRWGFEVSLGANYLLVLPLLLLTRNALQYGPPTPPASS